MSKRHDIRVPDIGDFEQVPVIELLAAAGDTVEAEQSLITLESDKATMDVPSPAAGKLVELKVAEGDKVSEGDLIGVLELDADDEEAGTRDQGPAEGGSGRRSAGSPRTPPDRNRCNRASHPPTTIRGRRRDGACTGAPD